MSEIEPNRKPENSLLLNVKNLDEIDFLKSKYEEAIVASDLNGKYQRMLFVIFATTIFSCCLIITAFPIQKEIPNYYCIKHIDFEDDVLFEYTIYKTDKRFKIIMNEECIRKYCSKVENFNSPILWVLVADYGTVRNFVTMLDTMCVLDIYSGDFTRMTFTGRLIAILLFSYISDNYGRKPTFFAGCVCLIVSNLGFILFRNKFIYLLLGLISNMSMQLYNLVTIASVECMNTNMYSVLNGMLSFIFAFCGMFNIFIMYFFSDWLVLVAIHLFLDIFVIFYSYFNLTEMPYYSLTKGDYKSLKKILIKCSQMNGTYETKVKPILNEIKSCKKRHKNFAISKTNAIENNKNKITIRFVINSLFASYLAIFNKKSDLGKLIKMIFPFMTVQLVYYGMLVYVEKIPGNIKLNTFLIFFSELFSPNLVGYLLKTTGRKKIITIIHAICIITSLLFANVSNSTLMSALLFTNAFCICGNFVGTYLYTAELFDSRIKSTANGILTLIATFAMLFMDKLIDIFPSPFYLFAILCSISIFSIFSLPETLKH